MARFRMCGGRVKPAGPEAGTPAASGPTILPTVEQQCQEFLGFVLKGVDVHPVQRREMRRSFYAGYFSLLTSMTGPLSMVIEAGGEEAGSRELEAWLAECNAFYERVTRDED